MAGDTAGDPQTVRDVLALIDADWTRLVGLIRRLDDDVLTEPDSTGAGWSIKDHLTHVTAWEEYLLAILERRSWRSGLGLEQADLQAFDVDRINEIVQAQRQGRTLDRVLHDLAATHQQVVATIGRLSDADLRRPAADSQPDDSRPGVRPLIHSIVGNTYEHYREHVEWIEDLLERRSPQVP